MHSQNRHTPFSFMVALLALLTFAALPATAAETPDREPVIFIGGGTIDDQVAAILLFAMEDIDLLGSITTNSDCLYSYAMQNQWRIQQALGVEYPITLSRARGWNPFPMEYRRDSLKVYAAKGLKQHGDNPAWPAQYESGETFLKAHLARAIEDDRPITLLITEPLTPLSTVLMETPRLEQGIRRVIWMGGAIDTPGNLDPNTLPPELANPKAEWNVFWDPYGVQWIFENTDFPLVMFPLDVTNQAKLTRAFLDELNRQADRYVYSKVAASIYNLVQGQPYFEMWNSLTAAFLHRPDIFAPPQTMRLSVATEGFMQGAITRSKSGRSAEVVLSIKDKDAFYRYVLEQLQRN